MLIGDSHLGGIRRNLFNNSLTKYNVTSNYSVVLKKYMERYITPPLTEQKPSIAAIHTGENDLS